MDLVRDRLPWKLRNRELILGPRTLLMGILDAGPATASAEDRVSPDDLLQRAVGLERDGADLLDIEVSGGAPGEGQARGGGTASSLLDSDDELRRLVPVLRKLRHNLDIPVCVTTHHAATAQRALELGVAVIRDWSGLCFDPSLAKVVNRYDAGLVLGHVRGTPESWAKLPPLSDPASAIVKDLDNSVARARAAGIDRRRIVLDPGFEQGKKGAENLAVLARLDVLAGLHQPILVNLSGKRFLTESVRASEAERHGAEAAATTAALLSGAHILRVRSLEEPGYVAKFVDRVFEAVERG